MEWERGSRCGCGLSTESSVWDRSIGGLARVGGGGPRLGVWPGVLGVCCDESSRQRVWYAVLPGRGGCGRGCGRVWSGRSGRSERGICGRGRHWDGLAAVGVGGGRGFLAATASEGLNDVRSERRESRSKSDSGGCGGGCSLSGGREGQ